MYPINKTLSAFREESIIYLHAYHVYILKIKIVETERSEVSRSLVVYSNSKLLWL